MSEVFTFFIDNMHMIWGDDVGPLFTWPIVLLGISGIVYAARTKDQFALFLCANLFIGFGIESLLLGNQPAHRYMHANIWAAFGLVGYGADWALQRVKPWIWRPVLASTALVIIVEACISEVPHAQDRGWLNTREQSLVAATVADTFTLSEDEMARRVHGTYFGETMGLGHYHTLFNQDEDIQPFSTTAHVLVAPSDLPLGVGTLDITEEKRISGNARNIRIVAFEPRLLDIQYSDGLESRWRESSARSYGPGWHRIDARVIQPTQVTLLLSRSRTGRDHCNIAVRQVVSVPTQEVATPRYPELRLIQFTANSGDLVIDIGPCPTPRMIDVF